MLGSLDWLRLFKLFSLVFFLLGCFMMFRLLLIALVPSISSSLVLGMLLVVFGFFDCFQIVFKIVFWVDRFWFCLGYCWFCLVVFWLCWLLGFFVLFYVVLGCRSLCQFV